MDPGRRKKIGVDAGSAYLKLVVLNEKDEIERSCYQPHQGEPVELLLDVFKKTGVNQQDRIACTGFYAPLIEETLGIAAADSVSALVTAIKSNHHDASCIMDVGAKGSRLIELHHGRFKGFSQNSLCAAGTGAFLDQQVQRLGLTYHDVIDYPFLENPPRIAARCSVFAKTDLVHRQQEGFSKVEMWNGLCRGMALNLVQTLLRGRQLNGKTVLAGGVGLNGWVVEWLKRDLGNLEVIIDPHLASATGTAVLASSAVDPRVLKPRRTGWKPALRGTENVPRRPVLKLEASTYPDFSTLDEWVDRNHTEVRVMAKPTENRLWVGVAVGSTQTKSVLMSETGEIVADFYRKTGGDPIAATSAIFVAVEEFGEKYSVAIDIQGAGTTGSGRKITGLVIGADSITNEITCHARGALKLDPDIKTIFEIGGQDSKYIRLEEGNIVESNLNYICAAGTGSFVEEQAARLGIPLNECGPASMGKRAPFTSDRCTVFMEEDVERLLARGFSRDEVMAAVLYSVVQNYLTKVVENRPVTEKIAFQGATARNVGLVAAFENYLGTEILVSPYCHVLGAYGAALVAAEQKEGKTKFRGLDLHRRKIELTTRECPYCANHCTITFAGIEGLDEKPSWGYACGKEPGERRMRRDSNLELFEKRKRYLNRTGEVNFEKTIGMPMVLGFYTYLPFWRRFFNSLGYNVATTGKTTPQILRSGGKLAAADFCLPVKVTYGHMARLAGMDTDFIFAPHMLNMNQGDYYSYVCPYGQMFPALPVTDTTSPDAGFIQTRLLTPMIDLTWSEHENIDELHNALGDKLGISRTQIKKAWKQGWGEYARFKDDCSREGLEALDKLEGKGIVILGRPYSLYDDRVSSNLPREIARILGYPVFPPEFIPCDESVQWAEHRMFWDYGQTILNALKYASEHDNLFPVYITHFACGPDSCIITFAEELMRGKPFMILEVDEHSSAGGYTTRIEAFRESINSYQPRDAHEPVKSKRPRFNLPSWPRRIPDYGHRKVWVPLMHPVGSRFFASVFRCHGIDAEALPPTDREALNIGKALTLGKECLPAVVTIGTLVKKLRQDGLDPAAQAFFMPSSDGPCRFGQYVNLHRIILDRQGYGELAIINPSSYNSYAGLSQQIRLDLWEATVYADLLTKLRCKVKPYEKNPGETQDLFEDGIKRLELAIEHRKTEHEFARIVEGFKSVEQERNGSRPVVGIVGEIYVRCDPFSNEGVIEFVERTGGEAWLAPASEFLSYSIYSQNVRARRQKNAKSLIAGKATSFVTHSIERRLNRIVKGILDDRMEPPISEIRKRTERYLPFECGTEAVLTLGRAIIFAEQGASVVVNVSPFTCMPGTFTAALFERIEADYGIPVVNMFYDGEEGTNQELGIYLRNLTRSG